MNTKRPQILLTNDDGIQSPGLWAAAETLSALGYVTIAAPRRQYSGAGRSIPIESDGRIEQQTLRIGSQEWPAYAIGGSPAQSVMHGVLEILPHKPDLVVSLGLAAGERAVRVERFAVNIADYAEPTVSGLFTFNQLRLDDPDGAIAVNGQANITYAVSLDSADTSTTRVDMRIPAAGLVAAVETASFKETFTYAPDFAALWHDVTPVGAVAYSTAALSGKVAFTSLGKVLLATDPPFGYVHDMDGPQSGAVLITGHQSKLRLSVVSTTTARLELDANNDGTFESTRDIPWNELLQF